MGDSLVAAGVPNWLASSLAPGLPCLASLGLSGSFRPSAALWSSRKRENRPTPSALAAPSMGAYQLPGKEEAGHRQIVVDIAVQTSIHLARHIEMKGLIE